MAIYIDEITRVATDPSGNEGNSHSLNPSISADGRYLAFESMASNLVPGDTNGYWDVFVRDMQTGAITVVSTGAGGNQGNNGSISPSISADGRYVAFRSYANNLVPGDTGTPDVFVRDLQTGAITCVSTDASGNQGNSESDNPYISADGRYVAFESIASNLVPGDTNGTSDVFVRDLQTGAITRVSTDASGNQGNSVSYSPCLSADGRYVAFYSNAFKLVPGDTNGTADVFVRDLQTGSITRVSTDASGNQGNGSSA